MSGEPSIHKTYGALLDGYIISSSMYGVFCAQVVWYYRTYPEDRRLFKILVGVLWALESIHGVLISHAMWHYLIVRGSVNPTFFLRGNWSISTQFIPTEICVVIVESFYIMRMWKLMNRNKYALLPFISIAIGTAHVIGYVITAVRFPFFSQTSKSRYFVSVVAGSRVLTDIAIAGAMCSLLYRQQSRIAHHSKSLIKALFIWTLTTGLLTSVFTLVYFATYITMPGNFIYIAAYLIHGFIYANAMLASLNSRKILRSLNNQDIVLQNLSIDQRPNNIVILNG